MALIIYVGWPNVFPTGAEFVSGCVERGRAK